jgi:hypothetical protein
MDQFSKTITVGKEKRLFQFTRMENANGVKFFITSKDSDQKPIAFSLRQNQHGDNWKLVPGSLRWLYAIEEQLSDAIIETRLN